MKLSSDLLGFRLLDNVADAMLSMHAVLRTGDSVGDGKIQ
jgi:hypothetical protein